MKLRDLYQTIRNLASFTIKFAYMSIPLCLPVFCLNVMAVLIARLIEINHKENILQKKLHRGEIVPMYWNRWWKMRWCGMIPTSLTY